MTDSERYAAMARSLQTDAVARRRLAHLKIEPRPPAALVARPATKTEPRPAHWQLVSLHIQNASHRSALAP